MKNFERYLVPAQPQVQPYFPVVQAQQAPAYNPTPELSPANQAIALKFQVQENLTLEDALESFVTTRDFYAKQVAEADYMIYLLIPQVQAKRAKHQNNQPK